MPTQITSIRIFLGSPGDVSSERALIETVVDHWNKRWSRKKKVFFDLVKWETDVVPGFGQDPQQVVNEQIGDDYDILIALFWARIGTETDNAISGSVEEYERALERLKTGDNIQISFYFKTAPIDPNKIDPDQLNKLNEFKRSIPQEGGLYKEFSDEEQLRLEIELLLDNASEHDYGLPKNEEDTPQKKSDTKPPVTQSVGEQVEGEDDAGIIDVLEEFGPLAESLRGITNQITNNLAELTEKLKSSGDQITDLSKHGRPEISSLKPVLKSLSGDMDEFSDFVDEIRPEFREKSIQMVEKIRIFSNLMFDFEPSNADVSEFYLSVQTLVSNMAESEVAIRDLAGNANSLQRLTTVFNRAKRRFVDGTVGLADDISKAVELLYKSIDRLPEMETGEGRHLLKSN